MTDAEATSILDALFLTDKWGKKRLDAAAQKAARASLAALPPSAVAKLKTGGFVDDLRTSIVTVLGTHPDPAILKMLLASYRRMDERPDTKTAARLAAIKGLATSYKPPKVETLTFRKAKKPARDKATGVRATQIAWAEREGYSYADLELFDVLDAGKKHVYDALIHADDGKVFAAGTMKGVAIVAQGGCEGKNAGLCAALDAALQKAR